MAKKDTTKDPKEPKEPPTPAAKEKKEKKAVEKAEENAEEEGAEGEKKSVAKKRKAGGHGGPRDHPSFEEIIRECIRESKEDRREGVSRPTIKSTFVASLHFLHSAFTLPSPRSLPPCAGFGGQRGGRGEQHRFGMSGALTRFLM